jgi:hypothetical protein
MARADASLRRRRVPETQAVWEGLRTHGVSALVDVKVCRKRGRRVDLGEVRVAVVQIKSERNLPNTGTEGFLQLREEP